MKRTIFGMVAVAIVAFAMVVSAANPYIPADPSYVNGQMSVVTSNAQVTGGGTPPVVNYVWVLPDEDNLTAGTQIWPYASQERTNLYACVVVSDPNGRDNVADVYIDVYHPQGAPLCGSKKYQQHGVKLTVQADIEACKTAALNAGLITQAEFTDINYNIFNQPKYFMYKVDLRNNYCQPAGDYTAATFAVDQQGGISSKNASFTWIPSVILQIDFFNGVAFGELIPGVEQTVQGDANMSTPAAPTMKNEGNVPIAISVNNSKMIGVKYTKEIVNFDAQFMGDYRQYLALEKLTFPKAQQLCQTDKIDFSVKAPEGTPVDNYVGNIIISAAQGAYNQTSCA